jgi:hypothetical protein
VAPLNDSLKKKVKNTHTVKIGTGVRNTNPLNARTTSQTDANDGSDSSSKKQKVQQNEHDDMNDGDN